MSEDSNLPAVYGGTPVNPYDPGMIMGVIRTGILDEHLDDMSRWIRLRKEALALERASELQIGQVVRISDSVRPKMLAGIPVKVTGFDGDKIKVELQQSAGTKWYRGMTVTLSRGLIGEDY